VDQLVVLDAGPLGLSSKAPGKTDVDFCYVWIRGLLSAGCIVAVPEIARYEVRRELVRVGATAGLRRLDHLQASLLFLPLTCEVMDEACSMWAHVRRAGVPTAPDDALDGDAILAAQALVAAPGWNRVVIATTNVDHLTRFPRINAMRWWEIG
jgi:predicted nucleic acid-binding protein